MHVSPLSASIRNSKSSQNSQTRSPFHRPHLQNIRRLGTHRSPKIQNKAKQRCGTDVTSLFVHDSIRCQYRGSCYHHCLKCGSCGDLSPLAHCFCDVLMLSNISARLKIVGWQVREPSDVMTGEMHSLYNNHAAKPPTSSSSSLSHTIFIIFFTSQVLQLV